MKDNIHVKGIHTSLGSRAYLSTYPAADRNAKVIQRLIALGAKLVGKTKLCSFASSEWVHDQFLEFLGPFNVRGDGNSGPMGSSSGGAAALAAYEWLDGSIVTDSMLRSGSQSMPRTLSLIVAAC